MGPRLYYSESVRLNQDMINTTEAGKVETISKDFTVDEVQSGLEQRDLSLRKG